MYQFSGVILSLERSFSWGVLYLTFFLALGCRVKAIRNGNRGKRGGIRGTTFNLIHLWKRVGEFSTSNTAVSKAIDLPGVLIVFSRSCTHRAMVKPDVAY